SRVARSATARSHSYQACRANIANSPPRHPVLTTPLHVDVDDPVSGRLDLDAKGCAFAVDGLPGAVDLCDARSGEASVKPQCTRESIQLGMARTAPPRQQLVLAAPAPGRASEYPQRTDAFTVGELEQPPQRLPLDVGIQANPPAFPQRAVDCPVKAAGRVSIERDATLDALAAQRMRLLLLRLWQHPVCLEGSRLRSPAPDRVGFPPILSRRPDNSRARQRDAQRCNLLRGSSH